MLSDMPFRCRKSAGMTCLSRVLKACLTIGEGCCRVVLQLAYVCKGLAQRLPIAGKADEPHVQVYHAAYDVAPRPLLPIRKACAKSLVSLLLTMLCT